MNGLYLTLPIFLPLVGGRCPLYARKMCSELSSACTGMRRRGGL